MGEETRYGILVGVDGSRESAAAVRWAAREAQLFGVPLTLMCVVTPVSVSWPVGPLQETISEFERQNAEQALKYAREEALSISAAGTPIDVRAELQRGPTLPALIDASKEAQMTIVGSRGMGTLKRLVMGSVSTGLIHHAHGPITVVHSRSGELPDTNLPILLGIDGSPASEAATAVAFEEAARRGVVLLAAHVWSVGYGVPLEGADLRGYEQQAEETLAERLAGWQERYPEVDVRRHVEFDEPAHWLVRKSRTTQLVVLGSHGRGGFTGMLLGSISSAVAQSVSVPLTVVRPR
jgi:nucleotide-binding universal stress UspA family protein